MKSGIHPNYIATKVHCNGCDTKFETRSTVPEITVEICSNCHPFYTGKQKLVDTAGRVDKFRARQKAAAAKQEAATPKKSRVKAEAADEVIDQIEEELESQTIDLPQTETAADSASDQ